MKKECWYIYLIRCNNNSLYTGITTDVERRFNEHCLGKGAKYLRGKGPLKLVLQNEVGSKSEAAKLEYYIKKLPKLKKEELLIKGISHLLPLS